MSDDDCLSSYSRAQAIEDGVLIDVSDAANKTGFMYPVAITDTLFHQYIEAPSLLEADGQTAEGRLRDVLMMLIYAIRRSKAGSQEVHFKVSFLMKSKKTELVDLWAVVNGGDDGKTVITIMLEGED
jgi:hypothetical protein